MVNDQELIAEFVIESKEHLSGIENRLLAIEAGGAGADPALVNEVFRAVHSIKGAAGFLGLDILGKLAHETENVLNMVRNHELVPTAPVTDVLLRAADRLRGLLDDIDRSNEQDISAHLEALEQIVAGLVATESSASPPSSPPDTEPRLPDVQDAVGPATGIAPVSAPSVPTSPAPASAPP
ncbi:MAG: Hpt domain-containing protein, partial [Pirellulales bacterium]|nr:Hpt domain-containing protein [Pirellulales bacterium]